MATWQLHLRLVPRASLVRKFGGVPSSVSRDQYEGTNWWSNFEHQAEVTAQLNSVLPLRESWSAKMRAWGVEDGNRVDAWYESNELVELTVRIDARDPERFPGVLASLASRFDLVAINDAFLVRTLTPEQIQLEIGRSDAARFVERPEGYLQDAERRARFDLE